MRRKAFITLIICLFSISFHAVAEEIQVTVPAASADFNLVQSGPYTRIELYEGVIPEEQPGAPETPYLSIQVIVPSGAAIDSIVVDGEENVIAADCLLYPTQAPQPFSEPLQDFTPPDAMIYESPDVYPAQIAELSQQQKLHGYTLVQLRVTPLRYRPAQRELLFISNPQITISYSQSKIQPLAGASPLRPAANRKTEIQNLLRNIAVNPGAVDEFSPFDPAETGKGEMRDAPLANDAIYLLITNDELTTVMQTLVDRRTMQGLTGKLMTIDDVTSGYTGADTQQQIRNCIIDHYENHGTVFVCLGGDDSVVPDRDCYVTCGGYTVYNMPTDLYYGGLDGTWNSDGDARYGEAIEDTDVDLLPEVWVGRIPVNTVEQAQNYIGKVVAYETAASEDYASKFITTGDMLWDRYIGDDRPSDFSEHERVSDAEIWNNRMYRNQVKPYHQPTYYHQLHDTRSSWDTNTAGDYAQSDAHLVDQINNGYHHLHMATHGGNTLWAMEGASFDTNDAFACTNSSKPAIITTIACLTGAFDSAEPSLSEAFIRSEGGAVAYMGCSRYGWGSPGSSLGGTSFNYNYSFYKYVFQEGTEYVGEALGRAKMDRASSSNYNSSNRWVQFGLNLQGDPAVAFIANETSRALHIETPDGTEMYDAGSDVTIRWSAGGDDWQTGDRVELYYSMDSGSTWTLIAGAGGLDYDAVEFTWTTDESWSSDQFRVRVSRQGEPALYDDSNGDFQITALGSITVSSAPFDEISITGSAPSLTVYTFHWPIGENASTNAPTLTGWTFLGWVDDEGTTRTTSRYYTFPVQAEQTLFATYQYTGATRDFYVNDSVAETGFPAGSASNDGTSITCPALTIDQVLDAHTPGWGDTIHVSDCVCTDSLYLSSDNSGLTLRGAGTGKSILDGEGARLIIYASYVDELNVSGFTLRNGSNWSGAATYLYRSRAKYTNCEFTGNNTTGHGGAIYQYYGHHYGGLEISDCRFQDNTAAYSGGAIKSVNATFLNLTNCILENNTAASFGGVLSIDQTPVEMENCIAANSVTAGEPILFTQGAELTMRNCDFAGLESSTSDGVLAFEGSELVQAVNCIFHLNSGGAALSFDADSTPTFIHNNLFNANDAVFEFDGVESTLAQLNAQSYASGNIDGDPNFIDEYSSPVDCTLGWLSAALDAGDAAYASTHDIEGTTRPIDVAGYGIEGPGAYDIGAYESNPTTEPELKLSVTGNVFDFGGQPVADGPTIAQEILIANVGGAQLDFVSTGIWLAGVTGSEFYNSAAFNTSPLAPGATRTVSLVFDPELYGGRLAHLLINCTDTDESSVTVSLTGVGLLDQQPTMTPEPEWTGGWSNTVSWSSVAIADQYRVQCGQNSSFATVETEVTTGTSQFFDNLWAVSNYYYRVRAENSESYSEWSDPILARQDPDQPWSNVMEPYGSTTDSLLNIVWQAEDPSWKDENSGLDEIVIFWCKDGGAFQTLGVYEGGVTSATFDVAAYGAGFYGFYSLAYDNAGNIEWDSAMADVTVEYVLPLINNPAIDAEPAWTSGTQNTITWSATINATTYTVQYSDSAGFASPVSIDLPSTATSHVFSGLNDGWTYWYRVRALGDGYQETPWSAIESSTQDDTPPESIFTESTIITTSTAVLLTFSFNDSGTTPSGVLSADFYYQKDGSLLTYLCTQDGAATSWTLDADSYGGIGTYEIYSTAIDNAGNAETMPPSPNLTITINIEDEALFTRTWQFYN
ncbi:hypothetical protein JXA32_03920 [Candidatus Sumerlaeota bacterium]|nr:hypothetical protein [Candidatus Sumerlaeota bacterium]